MREIRTSGLTSGDGKRSDASLAQATAPVLDSTTRKRDGCFERRRRGGRDVWRTWRVDAIQDQFSDERKGAPDVGAYRGMPERSEGGALQVEIGEVILVPVGAG
jgi:hypothetical protein